MLVGGLAVYYTDAIWLRVTACRINRQTGGHTNAVYSEMLQTTDIQLTEKKSFILLPVSDVTKLKTPNNRKKMTKQITV